MKINGKDISILGAVQQNVSLSYAAITNNSEWPDLAITPVMFKSKAGFKTIKVAIIINGSSRQDIWERSSTLCAMMMEPFELELDGFWHKFFCVLKNPEQAESAMFRWHKATFELIGYEYSDEITIRGSDKLTYAINNPGTAETPCCLKITPAISRGSAIDFLGISRVNGKELPFGIKNFVEGKQIIVDGETGLITQDGENKYKDVTTIYTLPSLKPGKNEITLSYQFGNQIEISFKPRYL